MNSIRRIAGKFELIEDGLVFARFATLGEAEKALADRQFAHKLADYRQHQDYLRSTYQGGF